MRNSIIFKFLVYIYVGLFGLAVINLIRYLMQNPILRLYMIWKGIVWKNIISKRASAHLFTLSYLVSSVV